MQLENLKTPALIVDAARMRRNAECMTARAKTLNVNLRPHVKTHKCVEIARLQTAGNAGGIMVSTLAEARAFAAHGFSDITYGVPIEAGKFAEATELAKTCQRFSVITDDAETVENLNDAARASAVKINVFLEVDCGYHRCGVEPDAPEALLIARKIFAAKNLDFAGILTHAGHSYHARTAEELQQIAAQERDVMKNFAAVLRADGIETPTISIGSTPTITSVDRLDGVNEVRLGNYIFFDAFQATLGSCAFDDCALTVLAAIVHRDARRGKIVIDAGAVALSKDRGAIEFDVNCGYGRVLDLAGNDLNLRVAAVSQEHGEIYVTNEQIFNRFKVGERVRILANHSCLTAAQHDYYNVLENDRIVDRWQIQRGW